MSGIPNAVPAGGVSANGLWFRNKKWDIICGRCGVGFRVKLPVITDQQAAPCHACGAVNTWTCSEFQRQYDAYQRNRGVY